MGVSRLDMIDENSFEKLLQKCGKYISRIIYKKGDQRIRYSILRKLPFYISTYCFNVSSLDLTQSIFYPSEVAILAKNCKKIKELKLLLSSIYNYEDQLTNLFEVNKDLEVLVLYRLLCPSLIRLPEQKMKAITLNYCFNFSLDIFSSVSII